MSAVMDTQEKLRMSLDDLTRGSGRRIQSGIVSKRAFRRSAPYKTFPREKSFTRTVIRPLVELRNNCRRTGHFARDCPNAAVCNNCGVPGKGHIALDARLNLCAGTVRSQGT